MAQNKSKEFPHPFSEIPLKKVYFIGIGGIGMSALARWFLAQKWAVFGSDMVPSEITQTLKKEGVRVKIGQKKANIPHKMGLFVYNRAIPPENPEYREAKRRGVPMLPYSEALGLLTDHYTTISISGSHGKSTTTSLLSLILTKAGFDPTVIVGTKIPQFKNSNFRKGKSRYLVIEADEFHSSFHEYSPTFGIITNIDKEHLDWYKTFANVKKSFLTFIERFNEGGILVVNKDDKILFSLKKKIETICKKKDVLTVWYSLSQKNAKKIKDSLSHVPGTHNVSNGVAAATLARELGVKEKTIQESLKSYRSAWRRMEYKGKISRGRSKIEIYDDYGHHPTEIKKTLEGAREFFKEKNVICVFQPHQGKRLKALFDDFVKSFKSADLLILLPIYNVAGRDDTQKKYTSLSLSKKITNTDVIYLESYKKIPKTLKDLHNSTSLPHKDSVLIMMGAGNINDYTETILKS